MTMKMIVKKIRRVREMQNLERKFVDALRLIGDVKEASQHERAFYDLRAEEHYLLLSANRIGELN